MLITNYSYINKVLGRNHSGVRNPTWVFKPEVMRNFYCQDSTPNIEQIKRDSFPTGTNPPASLVLGDKGSLLSSTTKLNGSSSVTAGLANGINLSSNLSGVGTLSSNLSLITQLAASLSGSGTLSAQLNGVVNMVANLSGSGNLAASLGAIANMIANITGSGQLTGSLRGTANMSATIYVNQAQAEVNQLVEGVWNALASEYNTAGTLGEKLNDAASGGGGGGSGGGTMIREDELAQGGGIDYVILNSAASSVNNLYERSKIYLVSGAGAEQWRTIISYSGTSKVAKVHPFFTVLPNSTTIYRIIP